LDVLIGFTKENAEAVTWRLELSKLGSPGSWSVNLFVIFSSSLYFLKRVYLF